MRQRLDGNAELARKEAYLSELLRRRRVPAAEVLAVIADESGVATLSSHLPGIRLDRAMESLSADALRDAWRSAGEALRSVHEIALPQAGEIVGGAIAPFAGGWASWVTADLLSDIAWIDAALAITKVDMSLLGRLIAATTNMLQDAPITLIHNDALPQNILVSRGPNGWRCTGWLDWEFARAADPLWDLTTLDFRPARLVPAAFYEGYGLRPAEPRVSIYELLTATWRTRVELEQGSRWRWPPHADRIAYLLRLPEHLDRLAVMLGVG